MLTDADDSHHIPVVAEGTDIQRWRGRPGLRAHRWGHSHHTPPCHHVMVSHGHHIMVRSDIIISTIISLHAGQLQRVGWHRVGVTRLVRGNVTGVVVIRKHPGEVLS